MPAYLITFSCYGQHLSGQPGFVEAPQNQFGARLPDPKPNLFRDRRFQAKQAPFSLNKQDRSLVLKAIVEVCRYKTRFLAAAQVLTTHAHIVVEAEETPEKMMTTFKAHASRKMNEASPATKDRRRWARHGSTRYLWTKESLDEAVKYVLDRQGARMECDEAPPREIAVRVPSLTVGVQCIKVKIAPAPTPPPPRRS